MKIWIYLNGLQQGPYTFDQVKLLPMEPTTPVWYEGLPNWLPAAQAPVTAPLFTPPAQMPEAGEPQNTFVGDCAPQMQQPVQQQYGQYQQQPQPQPQPQMLQAPQAPQAQVEPPKRPATYMAWCIVLTVLCCSPFALAGIITGSISSSRYNSGDYTGAKQMSTATEWLLIISIVWAIIGLPVSMAFGI